MPKYEAVTENANILGEGPVWCPLVQRLYWVDVRKPALHRFDPETKAVESWTMPEMVGSLAVRSETSLLLAMQRRLAVFDLVTGAFEDVFPLPESVPGQRFNDGKCDPAGRFVAGTLKDKSRVVGGFVQGGMPDEPVGTLFQLDDKRQTRSLLDGITIPNGLAWSPDGLTMYFADTALDTIFAFDYDPASGELGERRRFARTDDHPGQPDGGTVDAEGFLWSAEYGGWRVVRYAPDGRIDRVVNLPCQQPTCCAFGGRNLDILFVTTANQRIPPRDLARQPLAGRLFALDVGVKGLPEPRYAG